MKAPVEACLPGGELGEAGGVCVGEDDPEGVGEKSGRCDGPGCGDAGWRTCGRFQYLPFDEEGLGDGVGSNWGCRFFTFKQAPQKVSTPNHLDELPVVVVRTCCMLRMVEVQVDGVHVRRRQIQACCCRLVRLAHLVVVHGHAQSPETLACLVKAAAFVVDEEGCVKAQVL